jgi:hypothetical protein
MQTLGEKYVVACGSYHRSVLQPGRKTAVSEKQSFETDGWRVREVERLP